VNGDDANQYEGVKRELADKYHEHSQAYTEAKVPFIWKTMASGSLEPGGRMGAGPERCMKPLSKYELR